MKEQLESLIEVYTKQIRDITYSTSYKEPSKIQTVSVLRVVINDLKEILKTNKSIKKYRVIRNWNGTENKNAKIIFEDGVPIGCAIFDVFTNEESVCYDYTFEEITEE